MRINPIQSETFCSGTTTIAANVAKKGYAVLIDGQKYFIHAHAKTNAAKPNATQSTVAKNFPAKINFIA